MTHQTIELNRRFISFSDGPTGLHVEAYLQVAQGLNRGISWEELLKDRWVVVLGEAGTGKSTEFRHRPEVLRSQGISAFFMDITPMAKDGPELAVGSAEVGELQAWRDGGGEAVFFLDSVDEAQLRHESLGTALRKLSAFMGGANTRVRVVVSCRVSDWDSASGRQDMADYISAAGGNPNELKIVQLMPLDEERVKRLALHLGASDASGLAEAVRAAGAQPFVARPLDVEWMVDYWEQHGKLGTLTELVERSLAKRLDERRPNSCPPSNLAKQKARAGLMRLAGLATLSGRWSFLVPGEASVGVGHSDTIDPREALEEWSDHEIRELLTRAVFDESTYGRVRIHHRTVQEYLAAKWLHDMLDGGLTRRELERLLFRELGGRPFVPAHLEPTAAWLSLSRSSVLERMIEVAPEALFQYGDPAGLSTEAREKVLFAYLERYQGRNRVFGHFERAALRRFAPALEDAVNANLGRKDLPQEAIAFLLQLAAEGSLRTCSDRALSWAADANADSHLRREAFRAAAALATDAAKRDLANRALADSSEWDQEAAGTFASYFYPEILDSTGVGRLLRRVRPSAPNHQTAIKTFVCYELPRTCPIAHRPAMLRELAESIRQTSRDRGWLLHGLQEMLRTIIEAMAVDEEPREELREALVLFRSGGKAPFDGTVRLGELRHAIAGKPRVRRWLFWKGVEEVRERNDGKWPKHLFQLYDKWALSKPSADDVEWLAADARDLEEPEARYLALDTLYQLGQDGVIRGIMEQVASSSRDSALAEILAAGKRACSAPEPQAWEIKMREEGEEREREWAKAREEERGVLRDNIELIRSGEHRYILGALCARADRNDNRLGVDVEQLRDEFGEEIAEAAVSGLKACWRSYRPPFCFEQDSPSAIPGDVIIGLAGLQLDFADGLDPSKLSAHEVEVATRYAARQLNGFPEWFEDLARAHPQEVALALAPGIEADLRLDDGREILPEILGHWRDLPEPIRLYVANTVLGGLEAGSPDNKQSLEDALSVCRWIEGGDAKSFSQMYATRLDSANSVDSAVLWWCALARMDPLGAVCHLEEFADLTEQKDLDEVMEALCARIDEGWGQGVSVPELVGDTEALERLIPIVYRSIRPSDDKENNSGRAQYVGPRDRAETFRGKMFSYLKSHGTAESVAALERLAGDPRMTDHRDVLLHHARAGIQHSIQAMPMIPGEALEWAQNHAVPVRNADDLHRVALDRLDDIRMEVEGGEFSERDLFHAQDEDAFQKHIARALEFHQTVHHYVVSREEEGDREKEPDVRVSHSACAGHPVSIEIKIAENWSFAQLRDALYKQLVGQYLRPHKSRHGILLLCSRPEAKRDKKKVKQATMKRKQWNVRGEMLGFGEIVRMLQHEARSLVSMRGDIDALDVFGIDFH